MKSLNITVEYGNYKEIVQLQIDENNCTHHPNAEKSVFERAGYLAIQAHRDAMWPEKKQCTQPGWDGEFKGRPIPPPENCPGDYPSTTQGWNQMENDYTTYDPQQGS